LVLTGVCLLETGKPLEQKEVRAVLLLLLLQYV
jgi:hypothetical protein